MKLYVGARAPNPRRVLWVMAEKGIGDIEIVNVDLLKGENRSPAYLARAGFSHVPALELDSGRMLTESIAICRYLESTYPEPNLFGRDPEDTGVIEMWTRRSELLIANPLMMSVRHSHPAFAALGSQATEVASYNRSISEAALEWLDERLSESEFIGADRLTIADIVIAVGLDFGRLTRFIVPRALTNLQRWRSAMLAREAATAGMQ